MFQRVTFRLLAVARLPWDGFCNCVFIGILSLIPEPLSVQSGQPQILYPRSPRTAARCVNHDFSRKGDDVDAGGEVTDWIFVERLKARGF